MYLGKPKNNFQIESCCNLIGYPQNVIDRFWSKVIPPSNVDDCWNWSAGTDKDGYGYFTINGNTLRAHRFSYEYFNGWVDPNLMVLHSCDNPKCVNPDHLSEGTVLDNAKDRVARGRQCDRRGSMSGTATLLEEDVIELLEGVKDGTFQLREHILQHFNITETVLANILNGRGWTNITDNYSNFEMYQIRKLIDSRRKLTEQQVIDIRQREQTETISNIARSYHVGVKLIKSILVGKTYYEI